MVGTRGELSSLVPVTFFCRWPLYLTQKGYVPTTVRNMMTNVMLFIKHRQCSFPIVAKLGQTGFQKVIYELEQLQSNVSCIDRRLPEEDR